VYADGQVTDLAAGVLSTATGVEATADSLFQIGSITKTWTATLIMQLADEGLLDIDALVRRYLPDFRVADDAASQVMTARQLLCHTAGFEGDIFTDTGTGDDCVQKYVATLATDPQLFPPGEMSPRPATRSRSSAQRCRLSQASPERSRSGESVLFSSAQMSLLVLFPSIWWAEVAAPHRKCGGKGVGMGLQV